MIDIEQVERRRRIANISVQQLAREASVDRRKLNIILRGLTDEEHVRIVEVLNAHA